MASTKDADLTCLCGAVQESGSLLAGETFPVDTDLCHCNICRYSTGGLFSTTGDLREAPSTASLANCRSYAASSRLTRYFCKVCGSYCFVHQNEQKRWMAFSGIITPRSASTSDVVKVSWQGYVGDTKDYQLAGRLSQPDVPAYLQGKDQPPMTRDELLYYPRPSSLPKQDLLDVRCHCGAVSVRLLPARGWGPGVDVHPLTIPPEDHRDKYSANFCGCRWCRLALGAASLHAWMFVERDRVITAGDERAVIFGEHETGSEHGGLLEGLRHYNSSPGVVRSFCGMCGATAFYRSTEMPHVVNVAVGLLRAPEGGLATAWVWWRWEHVYGTDEHVDLSLVAGLRATYGGLSQKRD